jgi:ubiquitin-protein ligase
MPINSYVSSGESLSGPSSSNCIDLTATTEDNTSNLFLGETTNVMRVEKSFQTLCDFVSPTKKKKSMSVQNKSTPVGKKQTNNNNNNKTPPPAVPGFIRSVKNTGPKPGYYNWGYNENGQPGYIKMPKQYNHKQPKKKLNNNNGFHYAGDQNDATVLRKAREKAVINIKKQDNLVKNALETIEQYFYSFDSHNPQEQALFLTNCKQNLVPALIKLFRNEAFSEWVKNQELYKTALNVVRRIAEDPLKAGLLISITDNNNNDDDDNNTNEEEEYDGDDDDYENTMVNISNLLRRVNEQAKIYSKVNASNGSSFNSTVVEMEQIIACDIDAVSDKVKRCIANAKMIQVLPTKLTKQKSKKEKKRVLNGNSSDETNPSPRKKSTPISVTSASSRSNTNKTTNSCDHMVRKKYENKLGKLKLQFEATFSQKHMFQKQQPKAGHTNQNTKKIMSELVSLGSTLPVHWASSIFVRVSDESINLIKALIIGPEGTPYENGCYEFDIYLPPTYPNVSPSVKLITTGQGTVRFNPNLYKDGKVCLSLLGTWDGPGWIPGESTLLQVLMSIQSLIFVNNPFFNEPGYESTKNTRSGDAKSDQYNRNVRWNNVRWGMLEQIRQVDKSCFKDVITKHFIHKQDVIKQQLSEWGSNSKIMQETLMYKNVERKVVRLNKTDLICQFHKASEAMIKQENDNLVIQKILKEMKNNANVTDTQLINVFGYTIEHVKMARELWLKKRCEKNTMQQQQQQ